MLKREKEKQTNVIRKLDLQLELQYRRCTSATIVSATEMPCIYLHHTRELTPPKLRNTFEKNFRNDLLKTLQLFYFHMVQ